MGMFSMESNMNDQEKAESFLEQAGPVTPNTTAVIEVTNRRYKKNPFWAGPKGLEYGLLLGHADWQVANAYPDQNSTYFVGQFNLPLGARIELHGHFGHLRYFSFTISNDLGDGVQGGGKFLRDEYIVPDPGSKNPFHPSNPRDVPPEQRKYTITIRPGNAPDEVPKNTLYTGTTDGEALSHLALRSYLPDVGFDGLGNSAMPGLEAGIPVDKALPKLVVIVDKPGSPNEHVLTGADALEYIQAQKIGQAQQYKTDAWLKRVAISLDPENAPAWKVPTFERFWNMDYSVNGAFVKDPETRVTEHPPRNDGAWLSNPDTVYEVGFFSLAHGEVVVMQGTMPTFPDTRRGEKSWPEQQSQLRYWSMTTGGTAPSGLGWATVYDEEIPLNENREFVIVMSRAIDRPANASRENGVKWIEFGSGEGYFLGARNWVTSVYIRYQASSRDWARSPKHIARPIPKSPEPKDAETMGPYYPTAKYTTKEEFEKQGLQEVAR